MLYYNETWTTTIHKLSYSAIINVLLKVYNLWKTNGKHAQVGYIMTKVRVSDNLIRGARSVDFRMSGSQSREPEYISLSCINEYLATDRSGYVNEYSSQISLDGVGMKTSARG